MLLSKSATLVLIASGLVFSAGTPRVLADAPEVPKLKLEAKVSTVVSGVYAMEAIVPSGDGDKLVFLGKSSKRFSGLPATQPFLVTRIDATHWSEPKKIVSSGLTTSVAFGNQDRWIVASTSHWSLKMVKNLVYLLFDREKLGDLSGFKHRIDIYDSTSLKKIKSFDHKHFGLKKSEILKHARISPDGKWLAFYTHTFTEQRGVYLYNFANQKTWYFGQNDDKHPTWSPDGTKILFHHQKGGNSHTDMTDDSIAGEEAYLGYYEMDLSDEANPKWTRMLVDDDTKFAYHKHPAVYPGGNLLFFHGKDPKPDDKVDGLSGSKMHVRKLAPGSELYRVTGLKSADGRKIDKMKHINAPAAKRAGLYFVGREEQDEGAKELPEHIYYLDASAVDQLEQLLMNAAPKAPATPKVIVPVPVSH